MAIFIDSAYQGKYYTIPNDDIPVSKKDEKWGLAWANFIYSQYVNGKTAFTNDSVLYDERLRSYAEGRQSPEIYKELLLGEIEEGKVEREGFLNVNFEDIFSPAPKYVSVAVSLLMSNEFDIGVDCIDEKSGTEKTNKKESLWFKRKFQEELRMLGAVKKDEEEYVPLNRDELELYASMGGVKLRKEVALEKALTFTDEYCNWDTEVKERLKYDLVVLGKCAAMDYVDIYAQKVKANYVNVSNVIIQYNRQNKFRDSVFCAVPVQYNIADLRSMNPDFEEEDLMRIAKVWTNRLGNPREGWWAEKNRKGSLDDGSYYYDEFKVEVLHCYWKSTNTYHTKNGFFINGEKVRDAEVDKKKVKRTSVRTVYECKWLIGTDTIFDLQEMNDLPRDGNEVNLPIHVFVAPGRSIIDLMITTLDQIQLTHLKLQNAMAIAPPNGLGIEIGALENLTIGKKKMKPLDMIKLYGQNGSMIYRGTPLHGHVGNYSGKPIDILPGGIGVLFNEIVSTFEMCFNHLAELSGIDRITTNSKTPSVSMPVGTQRMMSENTNTVLKPLLRGYINVKESVMENEALRISLICKNNKNKELGYHNIIGEAGVMALAELANVPVKQLGISMRLKPSGEERQKIEAAAIEAMKVGKNGQPGITMGEYLFITRQINGGGSLRYAEAFLTFRDQKNKEREEKMAQQNIEHQNQAIMQQNQQKHELEKDLITHQTNEDIRKLEAEARFKELGGQGDFMRDMGAKKAEQQFAMEGMGE
jgi:hypothetical protein